MCSGLPLCLLDMARVRPGRLRGCHVSGPRIVAPRAVLVLAALLPIGGHYAKHLVGPLKPFFMKDGSFGLSNARFGALLSASDWALCFAPILSGLAVDFIGAYVAAILFCGLSLFGHVLFCVGVAEHSFLNTMLGRSIYGIGESAVSISQGGIICHTFGREDLTMSLGIAESVRAFANWLGKVLPVTLADMIGNYQSSLWFGALLLLVSQVMSLAIFIIATGTHENAMEKSMAELLTRGLKPRSIWEFPLIFWLLVGIHVIMNNVNNIFNGIATDYILRRDAVSVQTAAFLGSLDSIGPIFLCSWISWRVNRKGKRMYWILFACMCSVIGFVFLLFCPSVPIVVCMILLSCNTIIVPTLLRSAIPMLLHPDMYGLGFGLYAGLTGLGGNINILVGWLKDVSGTYRSSIFVLLAMSILGVMFCVWAQYIDSSRAGCLNLDKEQLRMFEEDTAEDILQADGQAEPLLSTSLDHVIHERSKSRSSSGLLLGSSLNSLSSVGSFHLLSLERRDSVVQILQQQF